MNRAFFIILIPVALVVIGYFIVFRRMGAALPLGELMVPLVVLLGAAVWWMLRKKQKTE